MSFPGISPNTDPSQGILGGAALPQMPGWAMGLGAIGSAFKDMGAQLGGRPEDANNVMQYAQFMRQQQARNAMMNTPYNGDARSYLHSLIQNGVPVDVALQAAEGQRNLQGFHTLSADEVAKAGGRPGDVMQSGPNGALNMIRQSDVKSQAAIDQANAQNHVTPLAADDPRNPPPDQRIPGAIYGTDAAGNTVVTNLSGAKSPIAERQAEDERAAAMEAQMRLFGMGGGGASGAGDQSLTGDAYLASLPAGMRGSVKAIGDGRMAPLSGYALTKPGGMQIMNAVTKYNPNFDATAMPTRLAARKDFINGQDGKSLTAINTAVDHLGTLGQLAGALGNGDIQLANSIGQTWAQQTGSAAPTNFDTAKQIVGDEIVKALIGTGGSQSDREQAAATISKASSPAQLAGAIQTYQQMLAGKLGPLRQKYQANTKLQDFGDFLTPTTSQVLGALPQGGVGGKKTMPMPGTKMPQVGSLSAHDQQALAWANANPTDPRAAKIKASLGVK